MVFKNFLIVASKKDKAGINITTALSQFGNFNFYLVEDDILHNENLDEEKISKYDFIIFASKHQSEKQMKTLSVHSPGNFKEAKHGGKDGKISMASALFNKQLFENLIEIARESYLENKYEITLEATHHGPSINKPCVFIEIGSTEFEWNDKKASFVIAKTILKTIDSFKENPYNETAIAIGGPHYCPNFNKLQQYSNAAIAHIIASYNLPLSKEMIQEAIEKTYEDVDIFLLDWKSFNAEEKQQVLETLEHFNIPIKKTSKYK